GRLCRICEDECDAEWHAMGDVQDQWMQGFGLNIGQLRQAGAAPASGTPPAAANAGSTAPAIAERLGTKIKTDADLRSDLAAIAHLDMSVLLDVMTRLKAAHMLDDFADRVTAENRRVGVAILTVNNQLDPTWQTLVAALSADDRQAILARVP